MKRNAAGDGPKGAVPVGEVAGILPEEVPDKGFCQPFVAGVLHEEMLDLGGYPPHVEDPVSRLHPLQVDGDHPGAVTEEDIGGSHVAVDEDLVVLPHKSLFPPPFLQPVEILSLIPSDVSPAFQLIHNPVEVGAVPVNVHPVSGGSPVVQGGEKIGEGGEFLKEGFPRTFPDRLNDKGVERRTVTELLNQDTVETGITAERAGDIMGIAGKADTAQIMEIVEFPLHVTEGSLRRAVRDAVKKLPDNARLAAQVFVEVNVVGCLNPIHPEVGGDAFDAELREDVVEQIPIEGIFGRKMSKIFHESSIRLLNAIFDKESILIGEA